MVLKMYVLGIESSCDETGIAIVNDSKVLAHNLFSQVSTHAKYGGVIPEIAARQHLEYINLLIKETLADAHLSLEDISAFAAALGPGLAGGLIVGALSAKTLALICNKPFIAVNHLQAHALIPSLEYTIHNPHLILLLSGGHSQFIVANGLQEYQVLGTTLDDSVGEAFDKSARLLGLNYPGGKEIEVLAKLGDPLRFNFPKPLVNQKNCNFSFSGLKTAVKDTVDNLELTTQDVEDLAASLQYTTLQIILNRLEHAILMFDKQYGKLQQLVLSGGVAANQYLQQHIAEFLQTKGIQLIVPKKELCTDNGVMIAWAGLKKLQANLIDDLTFPIKVRWSLEDL
ncbi:tRNA N6-adenosine threonylcarbamoyltransferase [Candidatus Hepatincola sp. Av]